MRDKGQIRCSFANTFFGAIVITPALKLRKGDKENSVQFSEFQNNCSEQQKSGLAVSLLPKPEF